MVSYLHGLSYLIFGRPAPTQEEGKACDFIHRLATNECEQAFKSDATWPVNERTDFYGIHRLILENIKPFDEPLPPADAFSALTKLYDSLYCLTFTKTTLGSIDGKAIWDILRGIIDTCLYKLETHCQELLRTKNFDELEAFIDDYGVALQAFDHETQKPERNRVLYCMLTCFEAAYNEMEDVLDRLQLFICLNRLYNLVKTRIWVDDPKDFVKRMLRDLTQYAVLDPTQLDELSKEFLDSLGVDTGRMTCGLTATEYEPLTQFYATTWLQKTVETYAPGVPTDVTLTLKDGSRLNAHLALLSRGTSGRLSFLRMPGSASELPSEINLTSFDPTHVREVVRYLYDLPIHIYPGKLDNKLLGYLFGVDASDFASQCHLPPPEDKDPLSDLELQCADGSIHVHRAIVYHGLGTVLPDFSKVCEGHTHVLMRFLYTGRLILDEIETLLEVVETLSLSHVKKLVGAALERVIDQIYSGKNIHGDYPEQTLAQVDECIVQLERFKLFEHAGRAKDERKELIEAWQGSVRNVLDSGAYSSMDTLWRVMRTLEALKDPNAPQARENFTRELLSRRNSFLLLPESASEELISFKGMQFNQQQKTNLIKLLYANPLLQLDLSETNVDEDFINLLLDIGFPLGRIRFEGCPNISPVVMQLMQMIRPEPGAVTEPTPLMLRLAQLASIELENLLQN